MKACEQAPNYSTYQHGLDVANRYRDLYDLLHGKTPCYAWAFKEEALPILHELAKPAKTPQDARLYHLFHDCGKPDVLTIDDQGRRHFPGHANASVTAFKGALGAAEAEHEDTIVLIRLDMGFHMLKGDELAELCKHRLASTLLLTAWAELHANAEILFGGFESDSFKIKRKHLMKAGKSISNL
jgi:hypothetical protein